MDHDKIQALIAQLLTAIGEDTGREGLRETPSRVAKSYEKLFGGYGQSPKDVITVFDNEGYDEMIIAKDIDFYSTCEHHLLPFVGRAYVGYIPNDKIIGLSKMPRMVEIFSRRLQNQERLTRQIADTLDELLKPKGVGVVLEGEHLCMKARGVEKQNCKITTSSFTGLFLKNTNTRAEFLNLIR
ncbi:GTP cyclohydrolase I FolE [Candidatus Peregrinibacteria bacterium CG_4_10_14_0_2_um_filter_43_11]|nr:MAG: GTP cyclohydrolase I FolE [Candidatus Peregrinibacteria bacterium CG_4_10_14_0_2_um_filter_43_11]